MKKMGKTSPQHVPHPGSLSCGFEMIDYSGGEVERFENHFGALAGSFGGVGDPLCPNVDPELPKVGPHRFKVLPKASKVAH